MSLTSLFQRSKPRELSEEVKKALELRIIYLAADELVMRAATPAVIPAVLLETAEARTDSVENYLLEYDTPSWRKATGTLLSLVDGHINGHEPRTVVDAGSGPGISAEVILEQWHPSRLILVDAVPEMLEEAKRRLGGLEGIEYRESLVEDIGRAVQWPIDVIVMKSVVHYVDPFMREQMFRDMRKVLRRGGGVLFNVPFQPKQSLSPVFAVAQALAGILGEEYNIPTLQRSSRLEMQVNTLADKVEAEVQKAGLAIAAKREFVIHEGSEQVRAYVELVVNRLLETIRPYGHEYGILIRRKSQLVDAACQALSNKQLSYYSAIGLLAVK